MEGSGVMATAEALQITGIQKLLQPLGELQASLQKMPEHFLKFR